MFCETLVSWNIHIRILLEKNIINDVIRSNYINYTKLCVVMRPKFFIKPNNLFKQKLLTHLTYVSCNISVKEYSYQNFNWKIL